ncbi:MFS transporter [Aspergillus sclerotiicarbonarius CBS 121057]|uniref:MFS transporter n=1 Tax=Aspergillus sclerotiicarbonarius (strain CBS 121057 / IBT 28362) TaxID=1448318 RepID=A0A319FP02_ASPSB|nr:MFS transporter [Aspergillus sclerotiicarbonarius CBS 121057]
MQSEEEKHSYKPPTPEIDSASSESARDDGTASAPAPAPAPFSNTRANSTIVVLTGVSFLNTMGSGILTVALPNMSADLHLSEDIMLWPASVYALAAGCTLLLFGSIADAVGDKPIWLAGSILYAIFTLACGFAQTGNQLIAFRTLLGLWIAMCLPSAVSLMTRSCPSGTRRNIGFASMGMGQPLGYSVGLILGGVFVDTIGWRYGYYISAIINAILSATAFWALPAVKHRGGDPWHKRMARIDWIGAVIISVSLALLCFVMAELSGSYRNIRTGYVIALLVISIVLIPTFIVWMGWRQRRGQSALIPNTIWQNTTFTSTCIIVFFTWAVFNAFQYFSSLYFQNIQHHSALISAVMFLPLVIVGAITNLFTGYVVDKVEVRTLVFVSACVSTISPILMALVKPSWGYWRGPFVGMLLSPLHPDVLFTVSNLIISQAYPGENQGLAGAVFNAVSQIGNSVGLAISAVIAASVTAHSDGDLLKGYQAAYWLMFAAMIVVCVVSFVGLRSGGKVGSKKDE